MSNHDRPNSQFRGHIRDYNAAQDRWDGTSLTVPSEAAARPPHQAPPLLVHESQVSSPPRRHQSPGLNEVNAPSRRNDNEAVQFPLRSMLPSKWNVVKSHADVRIEKNNLRLVGRLLSREEEETSLLVVTDKPIPMQVLQSLSMKRRVARGANSLTKDAVDVYYFEVTIQKGRTWIGFVPSQGLPGPVTPGRFPGDCLGSIGMSSDGRLFVCGQEETVSVVESSTPVSERDTIGCGLEVRYTPSPSKIFFTKNGEMWVQPMELAYVQTQSDWYFPAVGVAAAGGDIFANFGLSYPFRWKGTQRHVFFLANEVVMAQPDSPVRTNVDGNGTSGISSPSRPSVEARIKEMRRVQGAFGHPSRTEDSSPAQPASGVSIGGKKTLLPMDEVGRSDDNHDPHTADDREFDTKLPPLPLKNTHQENTNTAHGKAYSSAVKSFQPRVASGGDHNVQRYPNVQSGMDTKLSRRHDMMSSSVSPNNASHNEGSASSSLCSQDSCRPSISSSGLYGRSSDKSIRLDEDMPDNDDKVFEGFAWNAMTGGAEYAGRVGAYQVNEPAPGRVIAHGTENAGIILMDRQEIDDATECARHLRECCESNNSSFVKELLEICRTKQSVIVKSMQEGMFKMDDPAMETPLHELMMLNDSLLEAIKLAEEHFNSKPAAVPVVPYDIRPKVSLHAATGSLDIDTLVNRKDVFSLICMLRAQGDKRLDSALALMRFAREAERMQTVETEVLRDEITSSGGMHSLLSLFRSKGATRELRVVVALAVAYLLPSFVRSSALPSSSIGLKIIECLRFLFSSMPVTPRGEEISRAEMCHASAIGVHTFWFNVLSQSLSMRREASDTFDEGTEAVRRPSLRMKHKYSSRDQAGETVFDQRKEVLELQELLEMTVSLIVEMAKTSDRTDVSLQVRHSNANFVPLVEQMSAIVQQMCAIDTARPIAVREGLLKILVAWMRSQDVEKIRCAAISVNELTSTQDNYMAGWIHSQIVNEGALMEIVKLSVSKTVGQDVRFAVADILRRLCIAPHTRAAVVESNCIHCLISLLYEFGDPSSQEVALAAGSALLQLVAGALTRSSVFSSDSFEFDETVSPDKGDDVISDVINGGAIRQFVDMARFSPRGKLRSMSVEALRVLSEDTHRSRRTRLLLCEDGAAEALGHIIQDDVEGRGGSVGALMQVLKSDDDHDGQLIPRKDKVITELYQALCAWANILERDNHASGAFVLTYQTSSASHLTESSEDILVKGCIEFVEVGGLASLLIVATMPLRQLDRKISKNLDESDLVVEACRSLASLSPLLLSNGAASRGTASWTVVVLQVLARILEDVAQDDDAKASPELTAELKFDALRGIGALAKYEPHKLLIVDKYLPALFHVKSAKSDESLFISDAASQVRMSVGLSEDDFGALAGNDPKLIGDWFCMQRSLLIQSMARAEILTILSAMWKKSFQDILIAGLIPAGLGRSTSKESAGSSGQLSKDSYESGGKVQSLEDIFYSLALEAEGVDDRNRIMEQYHNVYGNQVVKGLHPSTAEIKSNTWRVKASKEDSLLASHVYPLNSALVETEWILTHRQWMRHGDSKDCAVSDRVQRLLDCCIPSRSIQQDILPIYDLRPESSFDFRSLLMPKRRYFSFQREGHLVSQLCDSNTSLAESDDIHWTLGFTNSSFAGEFSETLVQALYRCPMIRGISFSRGDGSESVSGGVDDGGQNSSGLLANLAGALPPWVTSIIYDNMLNEFALTALAAILETVGRLSASQASANENEGQDLSQLGQKQGSFQLFAVRNSPHISSDAWAKFFDLLGRSPLRSPSLKTYPLASLKVLDLSGNHLGDDMSALVLARVLDKESGCRLMQLDLSRNSIGQGLRVTKVLRSYVNRYRFNQSAGVYVARGIWKSSLVSLNLGSNELSAGGLPLEIVEMLKQNALSLKSLDLSDNGLDCQGYQFTNLLLGSLVKNTCLCHMNLSGNAFSSQSIDGLLTGLNRSDCDSGLAFLRLEDNRPPLTATQRASLKNFMNISRTIILQRYLNDRERMKSGEYKDMDSMDDGPMATLFEDEASHPIPQTLERKISGYSESLFSASDTMSAGDEFSRRTSLTRSPSGGKGENMITVLFSAPLVYHDEQGNLRPFAKLDFEMERELLWQCLKEARRDIELFFDTATHDRLLTAKTKRCSCLHYSGHGHHTHLPFENGKGGPHWLEVKLLKELIEQNEGAPFKFVFVSACHSGLAGETFASAGVPHVVCCQQDSELKDAAALAFTRQFYLALAVGHTVKESFEQGCKAVRATPNLRNAEEEMKKFILLPRDGNHEVPVFVDAKPLREWPRIAAGSSRSLQRSKSRRRNIPREPPRSRSIYLGGARSSELSVRNMMQEDPSPTPPHFFLGREVDMYHVLNLVLTKRLVTVVGEKGLGRSSLVYALCHYVNERRSTIMEIDRIFFVKATQNLGSSRFVAVLRQFLNKLMQDGRVAQQEYDATDRESLIHAIIQALSKVKALLVIDRTECLEGSDEKQDLIVFLSNLFQESRTQNVRVLLTGRDTLHVPSIGGTPEQLYTLGPLNFHNTVRLFGNLCPHLHTPADRHKFFNRLVTDETQSDLLPTDDNITERTKMLFQALGDGIPSKIEKAAYSISSDAINLLGVDSTSGNFS